MPDLDLARRAVACPRWRWMPRMVDQLGRTVLAVRDGMCLCAWWTGPAGAEQPASGWVRFEQMGAPDFDDPATVGCVLALVREVWNKPTAYVRRCGQRWGDAARLWGVYGLDEHLHELADKTVTTSEAAALVAALESAP